MPADLGPSVEHRIHALVRGDDDDRRDVREGTPDPPRSLGHPVHGAALAQADDFSRDFQRLVTEYCWGACWGREALSRRDRSLLNLAMLGALNRASEFKLHVRGALHNGCTKDEIQDTLIQLAIYAGIPAGMTKGAIHISLVPESGWPHPILGTGERVAPSNPQSATSELVRRSCGRSLPSTQTGYTLRGHE